MTSKIILARLLHTLFSLLGILFLDWDIIEIIFLYLLEVAVIHMLFVAVALFAAQPIANHDADKWASQPAPIKFVSMLPPVYSRNTGLVTKYIIFGTVYILSFFYALVQIADRSLLSLVSTSLSLAVLAFLSAS